MNDYGPETFKSYRYVLVVIDFFSKFGWTLPLENKYAQSKQYAFSQTVRTTQRKPNLLETDNGKENVNKIFNEFLKQNNVKRYCRNTSLGAVFA